MSGRGVTRVIEWTKILDRTPPNLRSKIGAFKTKSDTIMSNNIKAKAAVTTIDWDYYRQNIKNTELVDDFQCKFEALEIPKAIDTKSEMLAEKSAHDKLEYEEFVKKFEKKEEKLNVEIERLCSLPPFEQMTYADIYHHFPRLDHRTSNWGYTDLSGSERRPFVLLSEPNNPPDAAAYIKDLREDLKKAEEEKA